MVSASRVISFIGLLALAASLPLSEREENTAWAPTINYPNKWTVWCVGASHHVYWDTSNIPANFNHAIFNLTLVANDTLFDPNHPLAKNFPLDVGAVTITVPSVPAGKYGVDLSSWDAGEGWSQSFEIKDC
ncbi:hypothetical protein L210DRAFT_3566660 [Boletus edulis BED1]|uniref:Uncharacterized protein n=1 Tax=Boletus edulis BED1 TaxID=1328754 RepID=A0AAD4BFD6_BOLED|nr:hypothetical protein L210DRAFT_3566660 [Boletus edulis BED1]